MLRPGRAQRIGETVGALLILALIVVGFPLLLTWWWPVLRSVVVVLMVTAIAGLLVAWMRDTLVTARVPLLIAIAYAALLQTDQSIETIRAINQEGLAAQAGAYGAWLLFSGLLGLSLYTKVLVGIRRNQLEDLEAWHYDGTEELLARAIQRSIILWVLVWSPFLAAAAACWQARQQDTSSRPPGAPSYSGSPSSFFSSSTSTASC